MYGPGQLGGGKGHSGKLNGEQFGKSRRKAYSYFGFQRWKSCPHSLVWARDFFILQITKDKESLISRCMVRTRAVLNWISTTTWWEKAKWRWSQMKGNNRLRRDKMSCLFLGGWACPQSPCYKNALLCPSPGAYLRWGLLFHHLRSSEIHFLGRKWVHLYPVDVRHEEGSFPIPMAQLFWSKEDGCITSTKVLEYETGPQHLHQLKKENGR